MSDSDFWRDLAQQFSQIDDPMGILQARWSISVQSGEPPTPLVATFVIKCGKFTALRAKFEAIARQGGIKIAPTLKPLEGWLEELRRRNINSDNEGGTMESAFGTILNLRQASEELCHILQSRALDSGAIQDPEVMDDWPLMPVIENDPRNRLSRPARIRIDRAQAKADAIRAHAIVDIQNKNLDPNGATAGEITKRATLRAAQHLLRAASREYAGLRSFRDFSDCMREEIESASNSLELTMAEQQVLQSEFLFPPDVKSTQSTTRPANSAPSGAQKLARPETIGEQIDRFRGECRWSEEKLAEVMNLDPTTVSRHIRGQMKPSLKNLGKYERVFSKRLEQKVVIQNTPRKRL